ncbi:plant-specific TFIIB-related protein PTF2 isoform X2 [Euphorbia lathyris]|uniref:plant-specific TFIIB-related protein PTF2 isoform X2 n=1 Tax=Euphorbia lathyris TaxID=212925 RepID=UPI0033141192
MPCYRCGHRSLTRDDVSGGLVCESCGTVQQFDNYQAATWGADGPQGVLIRVGCSGTGSVLSYRDKKIFEANKLIDDITFKLDLVGTKVSEIKSMINTITEGEFGVGDWFPVLIGACAYVVVRSDNKSLPIAEIGDVIGRDVHELGRMITRVVDHLDLKLPEFDIVTSFEKVLRNLSNSGRIDNDKVKRMREQGVFLIQCATKWFLTTGRRPLPIVAAVLVLVAELNGVPGMKIEEMARKVHAAVSTCKSRYRELLESIVKVAQALPWGKDVTVKNAVKNAPFVLRHMEMKLMAKHGREEHPGSAKFDLEKVVRQCLRKDVEYSIDEDVTKYDDSQYFEVQNGSSFNHMGVDDLDKLQLSHECLSMAYNKFLEEDGFGKYVEVTEKAQRRKRKRDLELHPTEWWNGKTELSKKLLLKQILDKDVGLNPMPPSFVNGLLAVESRRAKINAAKSRIRKIMHPCSADLNDSSEISILEDLHEDLHARRKRRKTQAKDIDWEDFVIETLLLHQVSVW